MENMMGPSQVVATRRSVERARMYYSISGVILKESGLAGIQVQISQACRNRFSKTLRA